MLLTFLLFNFFYVNILRYPLSFINYNFEFINSKCIFLIKKASCSLSCMPTKKSCNVQFICKTICQAATSCILLLPQSCGNGFFLSKLQMVLSPCFVHFFGNYKLLRYYKCVGMHTYLIIMLDVL